LRSMIAAGLPPQLGHLIADGENARRQQLARKKRNFFISCQLVGIHTSTLLTALRVCALRSSKLVRASPFHRVLPQVQACTSIIPVECISIM